MEEIKSISGGRVEQPLRDVREMKLKGFIPTSQQVLPKSHLGLWVATNKIRSLFSLPFMEEANVESEA